jgi:hypothetical protein
MNEVSEDPKERTEKYIAALSKTLGKLIVKDGDRVVSASNISRVADSIQRYLADARHYLSQGRSTTSLTSIAYAEGLLDALTFLELAQLKDPQ